PLEMFAKASCAPENCWPLLCTPNVGQRVVAQRWPLDVSFKLVPDCCKNWPECNNEHLSVSRLPHREAEAHLEACYGICGCDT
ncbi:hypothetical protein Bpfe_009302, partial [Biomphalaria pfeifferi]